MGERIEMGKKKKKFNDSKEAKNLAVLIVGKMSSNEHVEIAAKKIIEDYLSAKNIIKRYNPGKLKEKQVKMAEKTEKKIPKESLAIVAIKPEKH